MDTWSPACGTSTHLLLVGNIEPARYSSTAASGERRDIPWYTTTTSLLLAPCIISCKKPLLSAALSGVLPVSCRNRVLASPMRLRGSCQRRTRLHNGYTMPSRRVPRGHIGAPVMSERVRRNLKQSVPRHGRASSLRKHDCIQRLMFGMYNQYIYDI